MKIRDSEKAIIVQGNKLLICKFENSDDVFYLLPGGGQEAGEVLDEAVKRECFEETGYDIEVKDIIFVRECFIDKDIHRVEYMFSCDIIGRKQNFHSNMDKIQLGIEWLELKSLHE